MEGSGLKDAQTSLAVHPSERRRRCLMLCPQGARFAGKCIKDLRSLGERRLHSFQSRLMLLLPEMGLPPGDGVRVSRQCGVALPLTLVLVAQRACASSKPLPATVQACLQPRLPLLTAAGPEASLVCGAAGVMGPRLCLAPHPQTPLARTHTYPLCRQRRLVLPAACGGECQPARDHSRRVPAPQGLQVRLRRWGGGLVCAAVEGILGRQPACRHTPFALRTPSEASPLGRPVRAPLQCYQGGWAGRQPFRRARPPCYGASAKGGAVHRLLSCSFRSRPPPVAAQLAARPPEPTLEPTLSPRPRRRVVFGGTRSRQVVHRLALFDSAGHLSHVISQSDVIK